MRLYICWHVKMHDHESYRYLSEFNRLWNVLHEIRSCMRNNDNSQLKRAELRNYQPIMITNIRFLTNAQLHLVQKRNFSTNSFAEGSRFICSAFLWMNMLTSMSWRRVQYKSHGIKIYVDSLPTPTHKRNFQFQQLAEKPEWKIKKNVVVQAK